MYAGGTSPGRALAGTQNFLSLRFIRPGEGGEDVKTAEIDLEPNCSRT